MPSNVRPFNRNTLIVCLTLLTLALAAAPPQHVAAAANWEKAATR